MLSAFEERTTYPRAIHNIYVSERPDDGINMHVALVSRPKIAFITISTPSFKQHVRLPNIMDIYRKAGRAKHSVWSAPKTVTGENHDASLVTASDKTDKQMKVRI